MRFRWWQGAAGAALAVLTATAAEAGTFTARFENDLFYKADREYTSGQGFTWTDTDDSDPWARTIVKHLPFFPNERRSPVHVRASYSLDQAIFTPNNTAAVNPLPTDRPYAGWLHTTLAIDAQSETRLSQYALQIGVVGPWALGNEAQNFVHRLRGFPRAKGWHYQLHNEPGIVLSMQQSWRYTSTTEPGGFGADLIPHAGLVVGNIYDYADGGALARVGWLSSDWAPARIQPAVPGTNVVDTTFGLYAFGGFEGRAVARNIFLDGNTFESSRSVSNFPLVGEAEIGAAITFWRLRIAYTHVFLSREYRTQADNHQYGTLSIALRFDH